MEKKAQSYQSATNYLILTDLEAQKVGVFQKSGEKWVYVKSYFCSSGKQGYETPQGEFKVQSKGSCFFNRSLGAVSYTHLDVYKRQNITRGLTAVNKNTRRGLADWCPLFGVFRLGKTAEEKPRRKNYGSSIHETAFGSRCAFWPPDQKMEPKNGGVYLHRTQWNLHH